MTISIEPPRQPELLELLRLSDEYALSLYPSESCYLVDIAELEASDVTVFVSRPCGAAGAADGIAALLDRGDGSAELKRMFVSASARDSGVGRALLAAIDEYAGARGIRSLRLETGPEQRAAIGLYASTGFLPIPNFGQYVRDAYSLCMEKLLP